MAEEKPSLHVDTDWKKQAQEEKRRLAEQEEKRKAAAPAAPAGVVSTGATAPAGGGQRSAARGAPGAAPQRGLPAPGFTALVQSLATQILYYLGELTTRGVEPVVNLDMAKHNIETLGMLEEKTKGNLTAEEKHALDATLYETRMRFIGVASRYAELP